MSTEQLIRKALKNIQSRFFTGSVSAQRGFFVTKEDTDDLRKKVTRPIVKRKNLLLTIIIFMVGTATFWLIGFLIYIYCYGWPS